MKDLYQHVGFSKQAHHSWLKRQELQKDKWFLIEPILSDWRKEHPSMSLKKMYHMLKPDFIGRDKFIEYGMLNGFEAVRYAKKPKTTQSNEKKAYPNLLIDLGINRINQVWVSDITYFKLASKWHYITFIMDLYSRRIIGYHAASNLFAQANIEALNVALNQRGIKDFQNQLIHHSDRGAQYKSIDYTQILTHASIHISMGKIVYDNIHMERLNQTIKGEYLIHRKMGTLSDLQTHLEQAVILYNEQRPHLALGMRTPVEFESYISNVPLSQRTVMKVFALKKKKNAEKGKQSNVSHNSKQLILPFF